MDNTLIADGMERFGLSKEELDEALSSREWRVVNWAVVNAGAFAKTLQI